MGTPGRALHTLPGIAAAVQRAEPASWHKTRLVNLLPFPPAPRIRPSITYRVSDRRWLLVRASITPFYQVQYFIPRDLSPLLCSSAKPLPILSGWGKGCQVGRVISPGVELKGTWCETPLHIFYPAPFVEGLGTTGIGSESGKINC